MSEEILKLAQECGWPEEAGEPECGSLNLEAFYRAAFNAGLKEAEMAAESITDDKDNSDSEKMGAEYVITAIRALELRP